METILIIAVTGALNIVCFFIGAKIRQTVDKGEEIKAPTVSPFKLYEEHRERREVESQKNRLDTILRNIERYDGTGNSQEDVPK